MTSPVSAVASVEPLLTLVPRSPAGDLGVPAAAAPAKEEPAPDLRLVIEEDEATGAFIYKTLDRLTGEVVRQLPREDVLRMRADEAYAAGDVYDGTV